MDITVNNSNSYNNNNNRSADNRLLEAAASGQTDLVLQLLEEEGAKLHDQKDQVRIQDLKCIVIGLLIHGALQ
ncbi:hypothetical protein [Cylindrospermopsis raciborskii]|uniref:hypothetical protein n=1 Tax=Cylindrospermopsis raciborskii TaxID=77022 RepID=UPI0022CADB99|nr:hypothetical protein [Cylindrospermopsis raciborskii]MCZ2208006.1 hypothetical protein [Cylindrospermopsis raciborskii PAMP2011]